jgi:hypothetical protein
MQLLPTAMTSLMSLSVRLGFCQECTGHTQKNGAVSMVFTIETAPLFCVCPVFTDAY